MADPQTLHLKKLDMVEYWNDAFEAPTLHHSNTPVTPVTLYDAIWQAHPDPFFAGDLVRRLGDHRPRRAVDDRSAFFPA